MTFSIIERESDRQRVIGTLWADDERRAEALASAFFPAVAQNLVVRRTEDSEIPMRFATPPDRFQ